LFPLNEEKDARIGELEEQIRHAKKDKGHLKEFKSCVKMFKTNFEENTMDMYAHI
jgi:hypothetical protein